LICIIIAIPSLVTLYIKKKSNEQGKKLFFNVTLTVFLNGMFFLFLPYLFFVPDSGLRKAFGLLLNFLFAFSLSVPIGVLAQWFSNLFKRS